MPLWLAWEYLTRNRSEPQLTWSSLGGFDQKHRGLACDPKKDSIVQQVFPHKIRDVAQPRCIF